MIYSIKGFLEVQKMPIAQSPLSKASVRFWNRTINGMTVEWLFRKPNWHLLNFLLFRNSIKRLYMRRSIIFENTVSKEIRRLLFNSMGSCALYKGMILAHFSSSGKRPSSNDKFAMRVSGYAITSDTYLRYLGEMPSFLAAPSFNWQIIFFISFSIVGYRKKDELKLSGR